MFVVFSSCANAQFDDTVEASESANNRLTQELEYFHSQLTKKQRKKFIQAEKIVWKLSNKQVYALADELEDYPLVPYLLERKLSDRISINDEQRVKVFLNDYSDSPLSRKLRRNWLRYLAKRHYKQTFIDYYEPSSDASLACTYFRYRIEKGASLDEFLPEIEALWKVGKSQPKKCDWLFSRWIKQNYVTETIALERIRLAADGGNHTLIPYLKRFLSDNNQYLADLWHSVRRSPANASKLSRFKGNLPKIESQIMTYALKRLVWRNTDLALTTLERSLKVIDFSDQQLTEIYNRYAIRLAILQHHKAMQYLKKASELSNDEELTRWRLAYLLKDENWLGVIEFASQLPNDDYDSKHYQYWLARAFDKLGQSDKAQNIYTELSTQRHYYGFLASARIGRPFHLEHRDVPLMIESLDILFDIPAARRALELREIGRLNDARREWRVAQRALPDEHKLTAAKVASSAGWHDQAILTLSREGFLHDTDIRFPSAYSEQMVQHAQNNQISPAWAFAIARRESSFMTDAVSDANARGLMQLLPSTAKYLEKKRISPRQLLEPSVNIQIGNKYLRYLMDKVNNNSILATAAYNAGWRRVRAWLPEQQSLAADLWVETIPFKETRNYVKAVLAYKQIYHIKLNEPEHQSNALANVFVEFIETDIPTR